jgi:hypothetical protein
VPGVAPLQPDVSRVLTAEGECVTPVRTPQRLGGVGCLTGVAQAPETGDLRPALP